MGKKLQSLRDSEIQSFETTNSSIPYEVPTSPRFNWMASNGTSQNWDNTKFRIHSDSYKKSFSTHHRRKKNYDLIQNSLKKDFGLIENFSETRLNSKNQVLNNGKSEIPNLNNAISTEHPLVLDMPDSRVMQKSRRARLQDIQKFQKKLGKIEDELGKIRKKHGTLNEKEKTLKSKRVKLVSRMRQRNFPVDIFNELAVVREEEESMGEEDIMELRAIEKLVEMSKGMEY